MRFTKQFANLGRVRIVIIAFVAFIVIMIVWGTYLALTHKDEKPSTSNTNQTSTTSQSPSENEIVVPSDDIAADATPKAAEEGNKIELIVSGQCEKEFGGYWAGWIFPQELEFNTDLNFARGLTACTDKNAPKKDLDAKSYQIILKKIGDKWDIIYRGKQPPCASWATQWGAPGDWAAAPPGYDPENPTPCGS